jgi:hypothetical protein
VRVKGLGFRGGGIFILIFQESWKTLWGLHLGRLWLAGQSDR